MNEELTKIMVEMADGNEKASAILNQISDQEDSIMWLSRAGITGEGLCKLWCQCAKEDKFNFTMTIKLLRSGTYLIREMYENLSKLEAVPFFYEEIVPEEAEKKFFDPNFTGRLDFEAEDLMEWLRYGNKHRLQFISNYYGEVEIERNKTTWEMFENEVGKKIR